MLSFLKRGDACSLRGAFRKREVIAFCQQRDRRDRAISAVKWMRCFQVVMKRCFDVLTGRHGGNAGLMSVAVLHGLSRPVMMMRSAGECHNALTGCFNAPFVKGACGEL
jgi:hypothetical protein